MITDWELGQDCSNKSWINQLAWFQTLDKRYRIEVERTEPYCGILKIFDHEKNDVEIYRMNTTISFDAIFGPDVSDVNKWCEIVLNFIDNEY